MPGNVVGRGFKKCQDATCIGILHARSGTCGVCQLKQAKRPKVPKSWDVKTATTTLKTQTENNARKLARKDHDIIILYKSRNPERNHYSAWGSDGCARQIVKRIDKEAIKSMFASGCTGAERRVTKRRKGTKRRVTARPIEPAGNIPSGEDEDQPPQQALDREPAGNIPSGEDEDQPPQQALDTEPAGNIILSGEDEDQPPQQTLDREPAGNISSGEDEDQPPQQALDTEPAGNIIPSGEDEDQPPQQALDTGKKSNARKRSLAGMTEEEKRKIEDRRKKNRLAAQKYREKKSKRW